MTEQAEKRIWEKKGRTREDMTSRDKMEEVRRGHDRTSQKRQSTLRHNVEEMR